MSNIERKYEYHDDGVLPTTGRYGITYLTLYSSGAGNVYDGWIYDPENKIPVSVTERTFGFRNPTYSQYCWDDEVVVDLSNAQSREEASEYAQGRITAFNTSVSDQPILLRDINVTGMPESQREAKATTVLFTAIPLVSDSYIQAMVEVQCKVNLSNDNTNGMVRIEAFYILNDESDRTMRPNPVHTFMVGTENEWHTLPFLYWNPALKHDVSNYIGVKLIVTGGTAEIGISDNPDYGNAMITLVSAGLTGDNVFSGKPISLEIFGKEFVTPNYKLDPDDYTVLCTYDTGEIYDVTNLCEYSPEMFTEIVDPITILTAIYQGLTASMEIQLAQVEYIELSGNEAIHGSYTLDISDYTVLAYFDNGDIKDVTNECVYSPAMGSTLTASTTLTAVYEPEYMHGSQFSDSLQLTAYSVTRRSGDPEAKDIIYTLYSDGVATITGQVSDSWTISNEEFIIRTETGKSHQGSKRYKAIVTGTGIKGRTTESSYNFIPGDLDEDTDAANFYEIKFPTWFSTAVEIQYKLTGKPLAMTTTQDSVGTGLTDGLLNGVKLTGFENMDTSKIASLRGAFMCSPLYRNNTANYIDISFLNNKQFPNLKDLSGTFAYLDLSSLQHLDTHSVVNMRKTFFRSKFDDDVLLRNMDTSSLVYLWCTFYRDITSGTSELDYGDLDNVDFLSNWDFSNVKYSQYAFYGWPDLKNINGVRTLDTSSLLQCDYMFSLCRGLTSISDTIGRWNVGKLYSAAYMFSGCINLTAIGGNAHFFVDIATDYSVIDPPPAGDASYISHMFASTAIISIGDVIVGQNIKIIVGLFHNCSQLTSLIGVEQWDVSAVTSLDYVFYKTWTHAFNDLGVSLAQFFAPIANWTPSSCASDGLDYFISPYIVTASSGRKSELDNLAALFNDWPTYLPVRDGHPEKFAVSYKLNTEYGYFYQFEYQRWLTDSSRYESRSI